MKDKFKDIPIDKNTRTILSVECKVNKIDAVYQKWYWDGIFGESLIFLNKDISKLSEQEIKSEVKKTNLLNDNSEITFKKGDKYTFINFNFTTGDI